MILPHGFLARTDFPNCAASLVPRGLTARILNLYSFFGVKPSTLKVVGSFALTWPTLSHPAERKNQFRFLNILKMKVGFTAGLKIEKELCHKTLILITILIYVCIRVLYCFTITVYSRFTRCEYAL